MKTEGLPCIGLILYSSLSAQKKAVSLPVSRLGARASARFTVHNSRCRYLPQRSLPFLPSKRASPLGSYPNFQTGFPPFLILKGSNKPAQGNTRGIDAPKNPSALKGRNTSVIDRAKPQKFPSANTDLTLTPGHIQRYCIQAPKSQQSTHAQSSFQPISREPANQPDNSLRLLFAGLFCNYDHLPCPTRRR